MKLTKCFLFILSLFLLSCVKTADLLPIKPEKNISQIITWGDSLTFGLGGGGVTYPNVLQQLSSIKVINEGVSGNTSKQIAARMVDSTRYYSSPVIIWAGKNNFRDTTQVKNDIALMVSKLTHKDYLILSIINGEYTLEQKGNSDYVIINKLNAYLSATYGSHYIDVRSYLVSHYDPTKPADVTDFNNDIPPASLRSDSLHLNAAGYTLVAKKVYESINILKQ